MALGGAAATAAASWVLCAGVAVLGWLGTEPGSLGGALQSGTLFWLLSNGVGVRDRRYPGHAGAVGRDRSDRVHDLAICGG